MRNFGIMSGSAGLGGTSADRPTTRDEIHPRDSNVIQFPSASILAEPACAPLERSQITKAALDILFLGSVALLISATASLFGIFGYIVKLMFFA